MQKFLNADNNSDGTVNTTDVTAIISAVINSTN